MKVSIKYYLVFLVSVFLFGLTMGGFFLPAQRTVQNEITLSLKPEQIYPLLSTPKHWANWSIWRKEMDQTIIHDLADPDTLRWTSTHAGNGFIVLQASIENAEIRTSLVLQNETFVMPGIIRLKVLSAHETVVVWENTIHIGNNPIKRYLGHSVQNVVHRDIDQCLIGLKDYVQTLNL